MPNIEPKAYSYLPIRVRSFDRVIVHGTNYRLSSSTSGSMTLQTLEDDPRFATFTDAEFYELHEKGFARVLEDDLAAKKLRPDAVPYRIAKPHKRAKAVFYEQLILEYERLADEDGGLPRTVKDLGPKMRDLALAALNLTAAAMSGEKIQVFKPPSVGHFNKMYAKYRDGNRKISALVSRDSGPHRTHRVDADSLALWQKHADLYAHKDRPTKKDKLDDLLGELDEENKARKADGRHTLTPPSKKVFYRLIDSLGAYYIHSERFTPEEADRIYRPTTGGFSLLLPGDRVDIDEKRVDLMVLLQYAHVWDTLTDEEKNIVERIKLWVVVAIDLATRYILAMRFCIAPNTETTIDVIRMAMSDKRETSRYVGAISEWIGRARPKNIYTDNGSGLANEAVADILAHCEIGNLHPEAGQPEARGHIESSFRTHRRVVRHFGGRTFKDIIEKSKYNPVNSASLPVDEFEKVYVRAFLDIYHNSPHDGLGGETPHNAWVRQTRLHKMRPFIEPDVMRHIFGMTVERVLTRDGLQFMGIPYHSDVLSKWFMTEGPVEVLINVGTEDLGSISFQKGEDWFIAENQIGLAPGISLPEWMTIWDRLTVEFGKSTALTLDHFYQGIRDARASGESAALNNPLGIRKQGREKVLQDERRLLHASRLDLKKPDVPTVLEPPRVEQGAFIHEGAPGYTNIVKDVAEQRVAEKAAKGGAAKKGNAERAAVDTHAPNTSEPSQLGSIDDIDF